MQTASSSRPVSTFLLPCITIALAAGLMIWGCVLSSKKSSSAKLATPKKGEVIELTLKGKSPAHGISEEESLFRTGAAQMFGQDTPTNFEASRKNLFSALQKNHPESAYLLGVGYLSGLGTSINEKHAYRLFQKSIENGGALGYGEAGRMREIGWGVAKDTPRAIGLYQKGAKLGDSYCISRLEELSAKNAAKEFSPADTANSEIRQQARKLLPEHFLEK